MMRDNGQVLRFRRNRANPLTLALACLLCALSLNAGGAAAAPYAQHWLAGLHWNAWAARPIIRAGLCGDDGEPCRDDRRGPYDRPVHARHWQPEPEPYIEEPAVVQARPDCVEERYAAHPPIVREPVGLQRAPETYDEPCGIRCWYKRLRAGYCGRGCDYYRFRMTQFPEGRLDRDGVRVACR